MNLPVGEIICGDCLDVMRSWPADSVDCCVTSPPYWGLRDYNSQWQIGLEPSPEAYTIKLAAVFASVWRVLKPEGTLWLNLGDSYSSGDKTGSWNRSDAKAAIRSNFPGAPNRFPQPGLKPKDLVGIPWIVAFALRSDGWYLRRDIIWHKPNPMPESVIDRPTSSHEYVFLLTKSATYWYDADAIRTPGGDPLDDSRRIAQQRTGNKSTPTALHAGLRPRTDKQRGHSRRHAGFDERWDQMSKDEQQSLGANARDVWTIATQPYSGAHFATFPPELPRRCILAGCPPGGVVLDPFFGSGTVGEVATQLGRQWVGIELNPAYVELAKKRTAQRGLFTEAA